MKKIDFIVATILLVNILAASWSMGYNNAYIEPTNDYFWIDNNRVLKDSQISPALLYGDYLEVIGASLRIRNVEGDTYIEFLDNEYCNWNDDLDSWIVSFKVGTGDMTIEEALEGIK